MRKCWLAFAGVLIMCGAISARQPQQPPANPPLDPSKDPLDALLVQWEAKMKAIDTISANVVRTRDDATFPGREVFEGKAQYMKPNLALLELRMRGQPTKFEKYVSTGSHLFEYAPTNHELRYHELPPPKPGQVGNDDFLSFLFGMKAEEAKRRYNIKFMGPGQDAYYYYVEINPRFPADKQDFQKAMLALSKGTLLPRLLTFIEPNGNRVQWDLPSIETGARLNREDFTKPAVPAGWKYVRVARQDPAQEQAANPPPRIFRPQK
jgi:TIGR03009 family protein